MYMAVQKKLYRILLTVTVYYIYENNQQDALYRLTYYSKSALHVSGDVFAQHQEHLTVFAVSGSIHQSSYRLVSWLSWNCFVRWNETRCCPQIFLENITRTIYFAAMLRRQEGFGEVFKVFSYKTNPTQLHHSQLLMPE